VSDEPTGISVIPSKLEPPIIPTDEVHRQRLDAVLDSEHQVVVVTAPAGYGKSTFVAGWLRRSPQLRFAWVSLDPLDRNPLSFWRHVTASIARSVPAALEADAILTERGGPAAEFVAAIAHALWEDGQPLVLVIDDLQHADAAAMRDGLTMLVERCRGLLRLVAISRASTPLPTHRWLIEGRAVELRMDALAFRPDEAKALMRRFDVAGLGDANVERLNDHVEGWVVGLLLSGLTLEGRPDLASGLDDLIRSDRHVADYLVDEVLDRLPQDLRDFAYRMSVPTSFDVDLAQRLTGRTDAGALLARLVRSNPFVVAVPSPPAYRFHHLLRSLLAAAFRSTDAAAFECAHRVTAAVMIERGHVAEAIASLLEIGAVDEAFDVVTVPVLQTSDQGRIRELVQWLEMLGAVQPPDPVRALDYAMALTLACRTSDAIASVDRAAELGDPADARFAVLLATMKVTALGAAGFVEEAARQLPILDAVEGDEHGSSHIDSRRSGQVVRLALEVGDLERAERWLPHVERHPEPAVSEVVAPALRSWLFLERGSARAALGEAASACASAERLDIRPHVAAFDALLSRGRAELLGLHLQELTATLEALDHDADALDLPFFLLRLWPLQLSAQALAEGWAAALQLTRTLDPDAYPQRGGRLGERHDELCALALLNCGLSDEAAPVVERLPIGIRRSLLTARGLLVGGRREDVAVVLLGHEDWRIPARLEALLLLAQSLGGTDALAAMTRALEFGRTSGMLAPFVLEGRRAQRLLDDLPVHELFPALASWQRAGSTPVGTPRPIGIIEPLTAKEHEVLVRLPSHATYRAIGAQLYVSVNTVKTYVRAIYRKLGVSSRAEAVEVARRCGLLEERVGTR
jgi:LuxR family transcriptional regulator, maltose regulon positive regulatory protein